MMDSEEDDVAYYCCRKCSGLLTSKEELKEHKAVCTGDSSGTPCTLVAMQTVGEKSPKRSNRKATDMESTPPLHGRCRKRKLPIDGECLPCPIPSKSPAAKALGKSTVSPSPKVSKTPQRSGKVPSAAVGSAQAMESPNAEEVSPRRYGLRTKAYDNLKAKLSQMSGRGGILPFVAGEGKADPASTDAEAPPTKVRKRREPVHRKKLILQQNTELDAVFQEVISSTPDDELEIGTLTPKSGSVVSSDLRETSDVDDETPVDSDSEKAESYHGVLVEKINDVEKSPGICKLIEDVKQSLQTKQAVLSITSDATVNPKAMCPEVAQNETVTTFVEEVEEDIVCEPVEVQLPVAANEETITTAADTGPTQTTLNTFNIETGPGGQQLTVHLVEYKDGDESFPAASNIPEEVGGASTDSSPRKKNEKLEELKKNAEGRESFSDFLQKVITAHAENEKRNQILKESVAKPAEVPSKEPRKQKEPRKIVPLKELTPEEELEIFEPTRIRKKAAVAAARTKRPKDPVYSAPNSNDYESVTEIVLGRLVTKRYRCKICRHETKFLGMMARHLNSHNSESPAGESKIFKCDKCDFSCLFRRKLKAHMKCHIKPYICEHCSYRTTQQNDLQRHMWRHTGELPFKCDLCDYACRQKSLLASHKRKHSGNLLCCDIPGCDYKTPYKNSLLTHKHRCHASIRRYSCATCGYQTNERSCFDKHIKMHLGLKENKCPLCNYRAITVTDIKRHMRTHATEKKFQCNQCSYTTAYETSLRVHLMKHAGIKPFQCAECGYSSNMKSKVRRHTKVRHQSEDEELIISHNIKFSVRSNDFLVENLEKTVMPPIMKISYGTREAANITMDDDNNIQDTQIVQEFVIENISPDTVVGTHQCADCRFSCKTQSALSLHKISYHSNNIVQIVNEEIPVKEPPDTVQLGSAKCVSGGPLPEVADVQEIQYVVSAEDAAVSSIVTTTGEIHDVDEPLRIQNVATVHEVASTVRGDSEILGLVAMDDAASDEKQTVHLVKLENKNVHKRQTVRFVTMEDSTSPGGHSIRMLIEDGSDHMGEGVQYHEQPLQYVLEDVLEEVEQTEESTVVVSDTTPEVEHVDTQLDANAGTREESSLSDVKIEITETDPVAE